MVRRCKWAALLVGALALVVGSPGPAVAQDLNGYVAQYECRAGNPSCDVDMTPPPCDVTIRASDPDWSAFDSNPDARVYCLECGDHWGKGRLWISSSGTSSARRWLRYSCPDDDGADPVDQAPAQQARLMAVGFERAGYWILQRLAFDGRGQNINSAITFGGWGVDGGNGHNILDRLLFQDAEAHFVQFREDNPDNTLQNSVVRNPVVGPSFEAQCVEIGSGPRVHVVNNEIYNCQKGVSIGNGVVEHPGLVIENNDIYATPEAYTDCRGNFDPAGHCGITEDMISLKAGGTRDEPARVIHNRVWGSRTGDQHIGLAIDGDGSLLSVGISGNPDSPEAQPPYRGGDWVEFRGNIAWDGAQGLGAGFPRNEHLSVVANVFWGMDGAQRNPDQDGAWLTYGGFDDTEFYFNTIVQGDAWMRVSWGPARDDVRCNAIVGARPLDGAADLMAYGDGTVIEGNAFYGTEPYSTSEGAGDVVRGTVDEGRLGDLCFWTRLLTAPERVCLPNVVPARDSPSVEACDPMIGSRVGVGIDDSMGPWVDVLGRVRDERPDMGAVEYVEAAPDAGAPADDAGRAVLPDGGGRGVGDGGARGDGVAPGSVASGSMSGACGCRAAGSRSGAGAGAVGMLALMLLVWVRRRSLFGVLVMAIVGVLWAPMGAQAAPCRSFQTPDANGYCSAYELDIGTPPAPDVVLTPSHSTAEIEAALNDPANTCIAFSPGDYRYLPREIEVRRHGAPDRPVWIRLDGSGREPPWRLSAAEQAVLPGLNLTYSAHIRVYRLAFVGDGTGNGILLGTYEDPASITTDIVVDSCEMTNLWNGVAVQSRTERVTVQNTYAHELPIENGSGETDAIAITGDNLDFHVVNCELHDAHNIIQVAHGRAPGTVIENTDIYAYAYRTDCEGNFQPGVGDCANEDHVETKTGGTRENPARFIHNRVWASRPTDRTLSGFDDSVMGSLFYFSGSSDASIPTSTWWLVQDNVFMDASQGVGSYWPEQDPEGSHLSFIGNIVYDIHASPHYDVRYYGNGEVFYLYDKQRMEVYLNTFIDAEQPWLETAEDGSNFDLRCNVVMGTGQADLGAGGTGIEADWNVFYDTGATTTGSSATNRSGDLVDWPHAARVEVDTMVRDRSRGMVLLAIEGGTTGTEAPEWPELGDTVSDASVTWRVVRAPYCFERKLLTGPERACIPFARVHDGAPEHTLCAGMAPADALGSRAGIGINDDVASWPGGAGILSADLEGRPRLGTPGALEVGSAPPNSPDAGAGSGDGGTPDSPGGDGGQGEVDAGSARVGGAPVSGMEGGCACSATAAGGCPGAVWPLGPAFLWLVTRRRRYRESRTRTSD